MKYLCLICAETSAMMECLSESTAAERMEEYRELTTSLRSSGRLLGCNRLQPPNTATTVRVREGKISVTDGPYAETKEQLGGYYLIEAQDLNEAIGIAARIPGARRGCVELRPVAEDPLTARALEP